MESNVAFEVIVQQRLQELEEQLRSTQRKLDEASTQLVAKEQVVTDLKAEVDRLTAALSNVQTDKLRLEFEFEKVRERDAASRSQNSAVAEVASQLRHVNQRLDAALSERTAAATATYGLQKEIERMKNQLQQKIREVYELNAKCKDSQRQEGSWKERSEKIEAEMNTMRQQFDLKMAEWFQKEKEATQTISRMRLERDDLKLKLDKKFLEHEKTHHVLKNTTDAFGECLAVLQASEKSTKAVEKEDELPAYPESLRNRRLKKFEILNFERSSKSIEEQSVEEGELLYEDLQRKHLALIEKFNEEIRTSVSDEARAKAITKERNHVLAENTSLALDLTKSIKLSEEQYAEIQSLKEHIATIKAKEADALAAIHSKGMTMDSLQTSNDEYGTQVKYLLKKVEIYERTLEEANKGEKRQRPLELVSSDVVQDLSVHDIVETNRKLKMENYRLKLELGESNQRIAELEATESSDEESLPVYSEPEEGDSQKRPAAEQPGPSRKKSKTEIVPLMDLIEDNEETGQWKEKWEAIQAELSRTKASHFELETHLRQELDRVVTQNAIHVKDLKTLEENLATWQTRYNQLQERYKYQGESLTKEAEERGNRIREMDDVINSMCNEMDTARNAVFQAQAAKDRYEFKYNAEKKAYAELQHRAIMHEAQHQEELKQMKDRYEAQIAENLQAFSSRPEGTGLERTMSAEGAAVEAASDVYQQLKDKDQVILELERRIQMSTKPLNEDMIYDLQSKLSLSQAEIQIEKEKAESLQTALLNCRQQFEDNMQSVRDEFMASGQEKEERLAKLESECEAFNLEILRWKGQCQQYQAREGTIKRELAAARVAQDETTQDLKVRLLRAERQNEVLVSKIEAKNAELDALAQQVTTLAQELSLKTEELNKSKMQNIGGSVGDGEQRQDFTQLSIRTSVVEGMPEVRDVSAVSPDQQQSTSLPQLLTAMEIDETPIPTQSTAPEKPAEQTSERPKMSSSMGDRIDLASLLEEARKGCAAERTRPQSVLTQGSERKPAESESPAKADETPESQTGKSAAQADGSDKQDSNKKAKWKKIVYKYEGKKKDDHGDDKKKDRPFKH